MSLPICPILSIRNTQMTEICVEDQCALYLPQAKHCSLLYIGLKAAKDLQQASQHHKAEGK